MFRAGEITCVEIVQRCQKVVEVSRTPRMNDGEIERRDRGPPEHGRNATDDDEADFVPRQARERIA